MTLNVGSLFPDLLPEEERANLANRRAEGPSKDSRIILPSTSSYEGWDGSEDFDMQRILRESIDPLTGQLRDLKIDDRDLPLARNFFEFSTQFSKANPPYCRQMWTASMLLNEICPVCTDMKYLHDAEDIPLDYRNDDPDEFLHYVRLMNYGRCPKCGGRKSTFLQKGMLKPLNELVLVWGQRCVVGSTTILTSEGLLHMSEVGADAQEGENFVDYNVSNGTSLEHTSTLYKYAGCAVRGIRLENGMWIEGTYNHPVYAVGRGFVPLYEVELGDVIEVQIGQELYGKYDGGDNAYFRRIGHHVSSTAGDRTVPLVVRKSTKAAQCEFLSGLIEANFYVHLDQRNVANTCLHFPVYNRTAVLEVYSMLCNMGVCPSITHISYETVQQWVVTVTGYYLRKLGSLITFVMDGNEQLLSSARRLVASVPRSELSVFRTVAALYECAPETTYDFVMPKTHSFVTNGILSHNSGKSTIGSTISAYQTHRYLKYPKLSSVYRKGIQDSTPLTATFVSLTFTRALNLLWAPYKNAIGAIPWFNQYHEMLDFYGQKYGTEFYRNKDLFIKYFHKNLWCYPSHPHSGILRGDTRWHAVIDELGLFPAPKKGNDDDMDEVSERANADEAHTSLLNSLGTVAEASNQLLMKGFDHTPAALMLGLSSPKSVRDKVMRLYRQSQDAGNITMLGSKLPTWKVNPTLPYDGPFLTGKRKANIKHFMRDFGAEPPQASAPFIATAVISGDRTPFTGRPNAITSTYDYSTLDMLWATLRAVYEPNEFPSITAIDAGLNDNSFSIVPVYIDPKSGKTVVPALIEIMPHEGRTINFNRVYEHIILPLARMTWSQFVVADRWNSIDILHRLPDDIPNIKTKQFSPRRRHFDAVLAMLQNRNLVLPFLSPQDQLSIESMTVENYRVEFLNKPVHHLYYQMMTVQDMGAGCTPDKGEDATDDTFRALVLGASLIHEPKIIELLKNPLVKKYKDNQRAGGLVSFLGRTGSTFQR